MGAQRGHCAVEVSSHRPKGDAQRVGSLLGVQIQEQAKDNDLSLPLRQLL